MSGCGLWHQRKPVRIRRRIAVAALLVTLSTGVLSCSSPSEPASTLDPAVSQNASGDGAGAQTAPVPTSSAAQTDSSVETEHGHTAALGSLLSLADLVDEVGPAVASISVESVLRGLFFNFADEGAGSGIIVRPDGYIVTSAHVVLNAEEIKVNLPNGESYAATVVGRDRVTDLAVIKIDAENLPTVTFGTSDDIRVGDWVVVLGNALALRGGPTVTLGIISAKGRTFNTERGPLYDMIQTDAAINEGNSGGPLVNLNGEVVGISTAILPNAEGIGFAVSSSVARPIIDSLIDKGRVGRPLIGLIGDNVTPARANRLNLDVTDGIIVTRLSQDGPAFKAGISAGDVITKINGIETPDMARFLTLLWTYDVGEVIEVEYIGKNGTRLASIELAERPPE